MRVPYRVLYCQSIVLYTRSLYFCIVNSFCIVYRSHEITCYIHHKKCFSEGRKEKEREKGRKEGEGEMKNKDLG